MKNDMLHSYVFQVDVSTTQSIVPADEVQAIPSCGVLGLRRSTRLIGPPERYLGYDPRSSSTRVRPRKLDKRKNDENLELVEFTRQRDSENGERVDLKINYVNSGAVVAPSGHIKPLSLVLDPKEGC